MFSNRQVTDDLEENSFGEVVLGEIGRRGTGNGDCKPFLKAFFAGKRNKEIGGC